MSEYEIGRDVEALRADHGRHASDDSRHAGAGGECAGCAELRGRIEAIERTAEDAVEIANAAVVVAEVATDEAVRAVEEIAEAATAEVETQPEPEPEPVGELPEPVAPTGHGPEKGPDRHHPLSHKIGGGDRS